MNLSFQSDTDIFAAPPIEPGREMAAYEALWVGEKASFKTIANTFSNNPGSVPSDLVPGETISKTFELLQEHFKNANIADFGVRVHGAEDYPERLRDAAHPIEFFYYRGWWDLAASEKTIAIVGTRSPSEDGIRRARKLVKMLVENDYTIFSGLATGIDAVAHRTAIEAKGRTVAVLGTPITGQYPKENSELQEQIANDHLLISQVPILRYQRQSYRGNRFFFPERNATMSALTDATVIIEAGETSGTLVQARAALYQKRKLFILDSCFNNPAITWPARFEAQGAIRVKDLDDILTALEKSPSEN